MSKIVQFPGVSRTEPPQDSKGLAPDVQAMIMAKMQEAVNVAVPHFPVGTPKETIVKAMENAKEGERFSMDVLIENNLDPESIAKADADRIAKKLENKNRW